MNTGDYAINSNGAMNETGNTPSLNASIGLNALNASNDDIDIDIIQQFKMIVMIILLVLIVSLGFFVYNLIKCYLPKWRGKLKVDEEDEKCNLKKEKTVVKIV